MYRKYLVTCTIVTQYILHMCQAWYVVLRATTRDDWKRGWKAIANVCCMASKTARETWAGIAWWLVLSDGKTPCYVPCYERGRSPLWDSGSLGEIITIRWDRHETPEGVQIHGTPVFKMSGSFREMFSVSTVSSTPANPQSCRHSNPRK